MDVRRAGQRGRCGTAACAALLGIVLILSACGGSAPRGETSHESEEPARVTVTTAVLERGPIQQTISAPGELAARRESRIGAEVSGRIAEVFVNEGDRVAAGDPLFQVDPSDYEVALRQAEAGRDLARAERRQIETELGRATTLKSKAVLAEEEMDRLTTQLAVARARERQAEAAVALAAQKLAKTRVVAPYAGSVVARLADEGTTALVQPQTIVIVLQETAELEARASLPESQLLRVREGDLVRVHVEGIPEPIETRVSAVADAVDPATHTYLVKMRIPNADHRLKAGVFAHVEIIPQAKTGALLAERESVRTEDGRTRLLVVRDGRVAAVPVEIGLVSGDRVEVLSGAAEGERIVVGPEAGTIAPGLEVQVRTDEPGASS